MPTLADWNQVYDDLDWDDLLEPHPLNDGRVFWGLGLPPLDGGPQLYDLTQNTRGGTLTNGPTWTATRYGPGINFDGVNDYIQLSSAPFPATNFTVSWRGNLGSPSGYAGVIAGDPGNSHGIAHNPGSGIFLIATTDTNNQVVSVTGANQKGDHFWSLLYTATTIAIYRDGILAGSTSFAATSFPWTASARIGYSDLATYLGTINELTVHNRLLGISEIQELPSLSQRGYPGVLRRRKRTSVFVLGSTGGTPFTASLSGSTTMSGALTKSVSKSFTGSKSTSAALAKTLAKTLTGTITNTAALGKLTAKPLAGSQSTTGGLAKKTSKSLAGSEAVAGVLTRATGKGFAASQGSSGSLSKLRSVLASFGGAVSLSGSLLRSAAKGLTGSQSTSAALTKATAKSFAASQGTSGSFSALKVILSFLSGTMATAGAIAKAVAKSFAGSQSSGGSLTKTTSKAFAASQGTSGSFTAQRVILAAFAGALAAAGSLTRAIARAFAGAVSLIGVYTHSGGSVSEIVINWGTFSITSRAQTFSITSRAQTFSITD